MNEEIVCNCKMVTIAEIIEAVVHKKALTVDDVKLITKASTGCGRCTNYVKSILIEKIQKTHIND